MTGASDDVVVSEGEAVVLVKVKGAPDRRAREEWRARLEKTIQQLEQTSHAPPDPASGKRMRSER